MRSLVTILSVCVFNSVAICPTIAADTQIIQPKGVYRDYALSSSASSFVDSNDHINKERLHNGDGEMVPVVSKDDGFVTLRTLSGCQTVNMPFGWYGLETGEETVFFTPDEINRIILRVTSKQSVDSTQTTIDILKAKQPDIKASVKHLPDGAIVVELTNVKTESGNINSTLEIFTPMPKHPGFFAALNLTCREKDLAKYKGMIGLILRDRKIETKIFEADYDTKHQS